MNFLGLGPGELVLVAVLGLIVFGPGRLPEIAAQIGRALRDLRQSSADIRSEFQRSFTLELDPPAPTVAEPVEEIVPTAVIEAPTERIEPVADTAAWRWETSQGDASAPPALPRGEPAPPDVVFWEWDGSPGSSLLARPSPLPTTVEWQWDDGYASSNGLETNGHDLTEQTALAESLEPPPPPLDIAPSAATSPPSA